MREIVEGGIYRMPDGALRVARKLPPSRQAVGAVLFGYDRIEEFVAGAVDEGGYWSEGEQVFCETKQRGAACGLGDLVFTGYVVVERSLAMAGGG